MIVDVSLVLVAFLVGWVDSFKDVMLKWSLKLMAVSMVSIKEDWV